MKNKQNAFRMTMIFYLGVLLLPIGFYWSYSSFDALRNVTDGLRLHSNILQEIVSLSRTNDSGAAMESRLRLQDDIAKLSVLVENASREGMLIGAELSPYFKDLMRRTASIDIQKEGFADELAFIGEMERRIGFVVDKMVQMQLQRQKNISYAIFVCMLIYLIVMIYVVRWFIHRELRKGMIEDLESSLYSKAFFDAALAMNISTSRRKSHPLSMLCLDISFINAMNVSKHAKQMKLHSFAERLKSLSRGSDVVGRVDDDMIALILTDTNEEEGWKLVDRLKASLPVEYGKEFQMNIVELKQDEETSQFLNRSLSACSSCEK